MSTAAKNTDYMPQKDYGPRKAEILSMGEKYRRQDQAVETFVEQVNDLCSIVDREVTRIAGIHVPVTFESIGYPEGPEFHDFTFNDYFIAQKYITDGTVALLAETLGVQLAGTEIISARYNVHEDGNYDVIVGIPIEDAFELPMFLPEHTITLTIPASRYVRMEINEQKRPDRVGYEERMHADEYFIGDFREDTDYRFSLHGIPMNTYDETGDILTKYEPICKSSNKNAQFDTFSVKPVVLPPWKIACSMQYPGDDEDVIAKYFEIENEVHKTGLTRYYKMDYYGFPIDVDGGYAGCFGSRVSSFAGLPDGIKSVTLPGGLYVHITQKEVNGDNPSMPYDIAFNHLDELFFKDHSEYEFDDSRKVIARFRQANCASVFAPVKKKE